MLELNERGWADERGFARRARSQVSSALVAAGLVDLVGPAELVIGELVTNALLHTTGAVRVDCHTRGHAFCLEVVDSSTAMPVRPFRTGEAMTGMGLVLVDALARSWGAGPVAGGKMVWAELAGTPAGGERGCPEATEGCGSAAINLDELSAWCPSGLPDEQVPQFTIILGRVPTGLLLSAKVYMDNLVREFTLAAAGSETGSTQRLPASLGRLIERVIGNFAGIRDQIKRQAIAAARRGDSHVRLELQVGEAAAGVGLRYLEALDEADDYCRASRLLTLESSPQDRAFRRWYVGEIISQLGRLSAGLLPLPPVSFEQRALAELDTVSFAQARSERGARLHRVAAALVWAVTPEAVARVVLTEGALALGAAGGGILLATGAGHLSVPATVGYDDRVVAHLRDEWPDVHLPAAVALRTGQPVWLESAHERDRLFPQLAEIEHSTVSMCAVPLEARGRRLGAIRFSFTRQRLFDEAEREFVLTLAALSAQGLDRAQLYVHGVDASRRLQRSLLPPTLPEVSDADIAATYRPLGDGIEVGGDLYDVWCLEDGSWAFALGDVRGTGPEAAALTALVRYTLRARTVTDVDPATVLCHLNRVLLDSGAIGGDADERFCTVLFGVATSTERGTGIRLAGGGHPPPLVRRADGRVEELPALGTLIGMFREASVETLDVVLSPGDAILLYTDGAIEAHRGQTFFGIPELTAAWTSAPSDPEAAVTSIADAVLAFAGSLQDDLALLAIRARPRQPAGTAEGC